MVQSGSHAPLTYPGTHDQPHLRTRHRQCARPLRAKYRIANAVCNKRADITNAIPHRSGQLTDTDQKTGTQIASEESIAL
jgi:hypothetical protein